MNERTRLSSSVRWTASPLVPSSVAATARALVAVVAGARCRRRELLPARGRRRKPRVAVGGWGLERWGWVGNGDWRGEDGE
jgi:hypothetical protein